MFISQLLIVNIQIDYPKISKKFVYYYNSEHLPWQSVFFYFMPILSGCV